MKCVPSIGFPGQLVKICGKDFPDIPLSRVNVDFGNVPAKDIHAIRGNTVVCEVPLEICGTVPVRVSFSGRKSYAETQATFGCINPQNTSDLQKYVIHLKNLAQQQQQSNMQQNQPTVHQNVIRQNFLSFNILNNPIENSMNRGNFMNFGHYSKR